MELFTITCRELEIESNSLVLDIELMFSKPLLRCPEKEGKNHVFRGVFPCTDGNFSGKYIARKINSPKCDENDV